MYSPFPNKYFYYFFQEFPFQHCDQYMNTVKQMLHLEMPLYLKSAHILAISGGLLARWT